MDDFLSQTQEIMEVIRVACSDPAVSVEDATRAAYQSVTSLPNWNDLVEAAVRHSIMMRVRELRHQANRRIKNYHSVTRVETGNSVVVTAMNSLFNLRIGGYVLGELRGCDLDGVAEQEELAAKGHTLNVKLLRSLRPRVRDQQLVRNAVSESFLSGLFNQINDELGLYPTREQRSA